MFEALPINPQMSLLGHFKALWSLAGKAHHKDSVTSIAASSERKIASDCNRNSKNHCDSEITAISAGKPCLQNCVVRYLGEI